MENVKSVQNVYWLNEEKTRVAALFEYEDDTTEILSITVSDENPFWVHVSENIERDKIDSNTSERNEIQRQRRKVDEYKQQERETQQKQNTLFSAKIEAFEMAEVATASPQRRSKIRKAKSITEVIAHVAVCIIESERAADDAK